MKIYIINLKRSSERLHSITSQCKYYGLDFEVVKAVDGRELTDAQVKEHTRAINYAFEPGEIGCALSHIKIYDIIWRKNIPQALVLEDDALLLADLVFVLNALDKNTRCERPTVTLLTDADHYLRRPKTQILPTHSLYSVLEATCSHGYVINYSAAKNLSSLLYPIWMVADRWQVFKDFSACHINAVIPPVIVTSTHAASSTIRSCEYKTSLKAHLWEELQKQRPWLVKIKRSLWLAFIRPFLSINKN